MTENHDPYLRQVLSDIEVPAISPSVDQSILAAARVGLTAKPAPKRMLWSPRFLVPAGFALTLMLSVTVTLLGERDSVQPAAEALTKSQNRVELAQADAGRPARASDAAPVAPAAIPVPPEAPTVAAAPRTPAQELGDRTAAAPSAAGFDHRGGQDLPVASARVGERAAKAADSQPSSAEVGPALPGDVLAYIERQAACNQLPQTGGAAVEAMPRPDAGRSALSCTDTAVQLAALKRKYQGNQAVESALNRLTGAQR